MNNLGEHPAEDDVFQDLLWQMYFFGMSIPGADLSKLSNIIFKEAFHQVNASLNMNI